MALIFPRMARNFIKNGYYPTDAATLACISSALDAAPGPIRVIDPCCGEGAALAEVMNGLQEAGAEVQGFGIELDEERAWHAKQVLGTVAHADVHEVRVTDRSFGLLFLNPPYGDLLADRAGTGDKPTGGRQRHEKMFARRCFNLLQPGGILVFIVPFTVLDEELSQFIARHFVQVQVFLAPEQQFKQCVVWGVKRKPGNPDARVVAKLQAFGRGEDQSPHPEIWPYPPYVVPAFKPQEDFSFVTVRLTARQLQDELTQRLGPTTLWPRFGQLLQYRLHAPKRPLRAMSDWHIALALAAGQLSGLVRSADGRQLLVKGRTHKTKLEQVVNEVQENGTQTQTRVLIDRFVTVIQAIDMTPGPELGQIVTIR